MAPGRSDDGTPSGVPAASPNAYRLALPIAFGLLGGIPFGLAAHPQLGTAAAIASIALLAGSLSVLLVWAPQFETLTSAMPARIPATGPTPAQAHIVRRLGFVGVCLGVWWSSALGLSLLWATVISAVIGVVVAHAAAGPVLSVRTFAPMGLVALAGRAAWSASEPGLGWVPWTMLATATVAAVALSTRAGDQGDRIVRRGSAAIATAVQYLVFGALGLFTVAIPWLGTSITRRRTVDQQGQAMWRRPGLLVAKRSWRYRVLMIGMPVLLIAAFAVWKLRDSVTPDDAMLRAPAMAASMWWPELSRAQTVTASVTTSEAFGIEVLPHRLASPYLNIRDGRRVTWSGDNAARPGMSTTCDPVTIWMFGGSTMFGYGQRDDHTIASEVVRDLYERGVTAKATNFGVPGDTLWIQTRKLELELLTNDDRPDLVVFYDGVNEYGSQAMLDDLGRAGTPTLAAFQDAGMFDGFRRAQEFLNRWLIPNDHIDTETYAPETGKLSAADAAARQYRLSIESSARLTEDYDLASLWFLQPVRATRIEPVSQESSSADVLSDRPTRQAFEVMAAATSGTTIDLRNAMDGERDPVYYDGIHTNERGAELVAEAMLPHITAALARTAPAANSVGDCP